MINTPLYDMFIESVLKHESKQTLHDIVRVLKQKDHPLEGRQALHRHGELLRAVSHAVGELAACWTSFLPSRICYVFKSGCIIERVNIFVLFFVLFVYF